MHDEFYSLTEKLKNILKSLYGFGGRCHKITDVCLYDLQPIFANNGKGIYCSSADVRGAGTRDEPLRTSAWKASYKPPVLYF